jgi:DNA-binding phage protein
MKTVKAAISHHEREIAELCADRELGIEYLKAAMKTLGSSEERSGGLLALCAIAEAYGGLSSIANDAGISKEALTTVLIDLTLPTLDKGAVCQPLSSGHELPNRFAA